MAKTPTSDFFSTVKSYFNQLTEGERTPTEVAAAFNDWARESAESIKAKIAEEVERTVTKMGFVKIEEYEKLVTRVEKLEGAVTRQRKSAPVKAAVKKVVKKSASKTSSTIVKSKRTKKASK